MPRTAAAFCHVFVEVLRGPSLAHISRPRKQPLANTEGDGEDNEDERSHSHRRGFATIDSRAETTRPLVHGWPGVCVTSTAAERLNDL